LRKRSSKKLPRVAGKVERESETRRNSTYFELAQSSRFESPFADRFYSH